MAEVSKSQPEPIVFTMQLMRCHRSMSPYHVFKHGHIDAPKRIAHAFHEEDLVVPELGLPTDAEHL
jgi:hypothetical protein